MNMILTMCGRFTLATPPEIVAEFFDLTEPPDISPRHNIAPTQPAPAILIPTPSASREFRALTWGLIPSWAKDPSIGSKMINARAESLAEKPSYRNAFKHRRCLVVADGFYEWKKLPKGKQPYHVCMADKRPFAIAGLWENWLGPDGNVIQSCTLITTQPNGLLADIHDRMPVILPPERFGEWLSPDSHDVARLSELLRPFSAKTMRAFPVSTRVNTPTHDDPACIAPTGDIAPPEHLRASPESP